MGVCNHKLQLVLYFSSQRSLLNAPIFRLLLKVAVKGTHQCDFTNFWGTFGFQHLQLESGVRQSNSNVCMSVNQMCHHLGSSSLCYKLDNMDLSRIRHFIILAEGTRVLPVMCSAWWARSPIDNSIHYYNFISHRGLLPLHWLQHSIITLLHRWYDKSKQSCCAVLKLRCILILLWVSSLAYKCLDGFVRLSKSMGEVKAQLSFITYS